MADSLHGGSNKIHPRDHINKIRQVQHASKKLPVGVWNLVGDAKKKQHQQHARVHHGIKGATKMSM